MITKTTHKRPRFGKLRSFKCLILVSVILLAAKATVFAQANCADVCEDAVPCYDVDLTASPNALTTVVISGNGNCCSQVPSNYNCTEVKLNLHPGAEGISIVPNGPNQCSIDVYDGTPGCLNIGASQGICEPICPVLVNGTATLLICKPGNFNDLSFDIAGIPSPDISPDAQISESCGVNLTATDIINPVWSSTDDPGLNYLSDCDLPGDACGNEVSFMYTGPTPDCAGIIIGYQVDGIAEGECTSGQITATGLVTVYPEFVLDGIEVACTDIDTDQVTLSPQLSGPGSSCDLLYEWTKTSTGESMGTNATLVVGPQDNMEYCVSIRRTSDVEACAVSSFCAIATAPCCSLDVTCPASNFPEDDNSIIYQCATLVPPVATTIEQLGAIINDSCGEVSISAEEYSIGGQGCTNDTRTIQRIYTLTDSATGETLDCETNFYIRDETAPELSGCPNEVLILECGNEANDALINNWIAAVSAEDACEGDITVESSYNPEDLTPICLDQARGLEVSFTATDGCGNTSSCTGEIRLEDNVAPVLSGCPTEALVLECNAAGNEEAINNWLSSVQASDACEGGITVENTYNPDLLDVICSDDPSGLTITFTATDDCGNTSSCTGEIRLEDNVAPVLSGCPTEALVLECNAAGNEEAINNWLSSVQASDACEGGITVENTYNPDLLDVICSDDPSGLTITFTATDDCGNTSSCTGEIRLEDTTAPEFVAAGLPQTPITVDCNNLPTLVNDLPATDSCGGPVSVSSNQTQTDVVCPGNYTLTRVWTASDECGNASQFTQVMYVVNAGDPEFDAPLPENTTVSCDAIPEAAVLTATGVCSNAEVSLSEEESDQLCPGTYTLTRTWTATDECDAEATYVQVITVQDNTAPQFDQLELPAAELNLSCEMEIPQAAVLTAIDNCAALVEVAFQEVSTQSAEGCTGNYTITRTWTVTDGCNDNEHVQVINISDSIGPTLDLPSVYSFASDEGMCSAADLDIDIPLPIDNCDGNPVVEIEREGGLAITDPYPVGCTTLFVTVTDNCGNALAKQTQVCVIDEELPSIVCPPNILSCSPYATWELPDPIDNCGAMITNVSPASGSLFPEGETEVVIEVMDAQGNRASCSFMVLYDPLLLEIIASDYNGYGVRCRGGADGWLEAVGSGGYGEYSYQWNNGETTPSVVNLPSGMYTVVLGDAEGCGTSGSILLTEPDQLMVEMDTRDILCAYGTSTDLGDDGGKIDLYPYGGAGDYSYIWASTNVNFVDPGTAQLSDLEVGTYYYTVTDANGCSTSGQSSISIPEVISGIGLNINNTEGYDGNILPVYYNSHIITLTGGSGDYTYEWDRTGYVRFEIDNQYGVPGEALNILYADNAEWSVTIYDANGCSGDDLIFTNDSGNPDGNPPVSNQGEILDIDDFMITGDTNGEENTGSIDLTVVGGVEPYFYEWSGPGSYSLGPGINMESIQNLDYGFYEVTVTDSGDPQQTTEGFYWVPLSRRGGRLKTAPNLDQDGMELLLSATPNPFSESTTAMAWVAKPGTVKLELWDYQGKLLKAITEREVEADEIIEININRDDLGVSSGFYVLVLTAENDKKTFTKLVLVD